jgi:hypothetical protein
MQGSSSPWAADDLIEINSIEREEHGVRFAIPELYNEIDARLA